MKQVTKQTYQIFWQHAQKYKGFFWTILLAIVLGSLVGTINPIFFKKFFDVLAQGVSTDDMVGIVPELKRYIFIIIGFEALSWVMWRVATFTNNYFQPRVMANLSNTCFDYLHHHSFGFFTNKFVGSLVRKINRLIGAFEMVADSLYWNLLVTVVRVVGILVVLFNYYPVIGFILLGWAILYLIINYKLTLHKLKLDVTVAAADTKVAAYLADTITNNANVKIFTALEYEKRGFWEKVNDQYKLTKKSWDFDATIEAVQGAFMIALEFIIFWVAINMWQKSLIGVGDFVLLQTYMIQIFERLWDIGRVIRRMYRNLADAEEMVEILNTEHQVKDTPDARELIVSKAEVKFDNITFAYKNNLAVTSNFNLELKSGEKVGLVGHSGAGKTTLVSLLFRFYDVTQGAILIDGQNIKDVTQESLRQNISLVPQDPILFHRSLMENIRYGRRDATDQEVILAAEQAHCNEFVERLPEKYQTFVGERGIKLSGGERQRIAIARAILKNAPILVLDEATSSLDSQTEFLIQDALAKLMKGKTTLVIAHRLSTLRQMDRLVVVKDGAIVEAGSHDELLKQSGVYQNLWGLQAGGFIS
ncbi:MAG: ABC transporter ATP-binding protein [Patescibacteria group bacterium]